jgi:hypothetical protein
LSIRVTIHPSTVGSKPVFFTTLAYWTEIRESFCYGFKNHPWRKKPSVCAPCQDWKAKKQGAHTYVSFCGRKLSEQSLIFTVEGANGKPMSPGLVSTSVIVNEGGW